MSEKPEVKIELKGIKLFTELSEETRAFFCTVYVNGVRAFTASNDGKGGENRYELVKRTDKHEELFAQAKAYAESLPPLHFQGMELDYELGLLIDDMLVEWEINRWLKRQCKTKTLFRLPGDEEGSWRTIAVRYNLRVMTHIRNKYGDQAEIANDRFQEVGDVG
ncbi:MAG: hypothetical protein KC441_00605 [Anaerolineales bacterium]|nr:hypothetical protein [Anaerolineales bacterium]